MAGKNRHCWNRSPRRLEIFVVIRCRIDPRIFPVRGPHFKASSKKDWSPDSQWLMDIGEGEDWLVMGRMPIFFHSVFEKIPIRISENTEIDRVSRTRRRKWENPLEDYQMRHRFPGLFPDLEREISNVFDTNVLFEQNKLRFFGYCSWISYNYLNYDR